MGWKPRKHSWAQNANLLFIDNPVGTGFSYVERGANFCALRPPQHTARGKQQPGTHCLLVADADRSSVAFGPE